MVASLFLACSSEAGGQKEGALRERGWCGEAKGCAEWVLLNLKAGKK